MVVFGLKMKLPFALAALAIALACTFFDQPVHGKATAVKPDYANFEAFSLEPVEESKLDKAQRRRLRQVVSSVDSMSLDSPSDSMDSNSNSDSNNDGNSDSSDDAAAAAAGAPAVAAAQAELLLTGEMLSRLEQQALQYRSSSAPLASAFAGWRLWVLAMAGAVLWMII